MYLILSLIKRHYLFRFIADQDVSVDVDNGDSDLVALITGCIDPGEYLLFYFRLVDIFKYHFDLLFLQLTKTLLGPAAQVVLP